MLTKLTLKNSLSAVCLQFIVGLMLALSPWAVKDSQASSTTFYFGGTLTRISSGGGTLELLFSTGDIFNGSYTFDNVADAFPADPAHGSYAANVTISLNVSGYTFLSTIASGHIVVVNDPSITLDVYHAISSRISGPDWPASLGISLWDFTNAAFDSDALPLTPPPLSAFSLKYMEVGYVDGHIRGDLDYLSLANPIPEPEIYAMLGIGLGVMGWAARRKKLQAAT